MKAFGIRCRRPYRGPILTRRHRLFRRQWVQNQQQAVNWRQVIFSDESLFDLYHTDGRIHVYQRRRERFANIAVVERDIFGGASVMVWGIINCNFRSRLLINGYLSALRYIDDILRPEMRPLIRRQCNVMTFQQDNARPHCQEDTGFSSTAGYQHFGLTLPI